jgi:hypothetical protein
MEQRVSNICKVFGANIVLVGPFTPSVFHPEWFRNNELLRGADIDKAKVNLVTGAVAQFEIGAFLITVHENKLALNTTDPSNFEALRDLAMSIASLCSVTPIVQAGINFQAHLKCSKAETWHEVGNYLTPKDFWSSLVKNPGMLSVAVRGDPVLSEMGYVRITALPSPTITNGVFIDINNHLVFEDVKDSSLSYDAIDKNWKTGYANSLKYITAVADKILEIEKQV